ncbi:hypothetical protein GRJ2_000158000 [Grus japonensis]|uniref:Uncharacterized protein n=1 Tax=Grus japonensis TaxID=30415 RepID=A0ABC9VUQ7_GRUJA
MSPKENNYPKSGNMDHKVNQVLKMAVHWTSIERKWKREVICSSCALDGDEGRSVTFVLFRTELRYMCWRNITEKKLPKVNMCEEAVPLSRLESWPLAQGIVNAGCGKEQAFPDVDLCTAVLQGLVLGLLDQCEKLHCYLESPMGRSCKMV